MKKIDNKIVCVSGYFDPLHMGHIEYFKLAKELGDELVVILNNDFQNQLKNRTSFMPEYERKVIIESIRYVDRAVISIDNDRTVCKTLEYVKPHIFANGGDRHNYEIPESSICKKLNIEIIDGLGKKIQSSSILKSEWSKKKK